VAGDKGVGKGGKSKGGKSKGLLDVPYVVVRSPPLNIAAAREVARKCALSEVCPWKSGLTVLDVVEGVALWVVQGDGPFAFTLDLYHESGVARKLDAKL
jgi:hypothetical protein